MNGLFVVTNDQETANRMLKDGCKLYCIDQAKNWVFSNNPKLQFSEDVKKKVVFTNIISM